MPLMLAYPMENKGTRYRRSPSYSRDDCPEHYNLGIQEAGDAVSFPDNPAIRSAEADTNRHDKALDVGKQARSFESESNSMATPRAPQPNATCYSGPENLKATTASEADEAQDTPPADGRVGSDDLTGIRYNVQCLTGVTQTLIPWIVLWMTRIGHQPMVSTCEDLLVVRRYVSRTTAPWDLMLSRWEAISK
ncbi:MAG: hypothetical protein M1835_003816 [Candelina submexicana]|nr:MAG: hypothetical protein M1835_003816 [Candelina submexicana]